MRTSLRGTLTAFILLSMGALWMLACGSDTTTQAEGPEGTPALELEAAPEPTLETPITAEVAPEEGVAEGSEEAADRERELELRERELALREREVALKEAELQQRKARERSAPKPEPAPSQQQAAAAPAAEPAPEPEPQEVASAPPIPEPPRAVWVTLPVGTEIDVEFLSRLASDSSSQGDTFRTRVLEPIYREDLQVVPAGSEILGRVLEAVSVEKKVGGQARLSLEFTDLVLPSGPTIPISASFGELGKKQTGKDAATIGGAAAAGAILGRILDRGEHKTKGTIIGAVVGAAAGTAAAAKRPGDEVEIPDGAVLRLRLEKAVEVRVPR